MLNDDVYHDLLYNRDLRYKINFPIQNPLPVATLITFNNRTLCVGPPGKKIKTFSNF